MILSGTWIQAKSTATAAKMPVHMIDCKGVCMHSYAYKHNFTHTHSMQCVCMYALCEWYVYAYIHAQTHFQNFKSFRFVCLILFKFIHFFPFWWWCWLWRSTHDSTHMIQRIACIFFPWNHHFSFTLRKYDHYTCFRYMFPSVPQMHNNQHHQQQQRIYIFMAEKKW